MSSTATRRTQRLIVRKVEDETVVYDLDNDQVTCLDVRTAAVWQASDGRHSVGHVARTLDMSRDDVAVALVRLDEAGLMNGGGGMSRRTVLKGLGVGAAVVPLMTVMAPPAWAACSSVAATITFGGESCTADRKKQVAFTISGFPAGTPVLVSLRKGAVIYGTVSVTPTVDCAETIGTLTTDAAFTASVTNVKLTTSQTVNGVTRNPSSANFNLAAC